MILQQVKVNEKHKKDIASKLLKCFAINFEKLYSKQQLTYNLHNLDFYLCVDVKRHGSTSLHSFFSIKSILGEITRSLKGNWRISNQIISSNLY